MVGHRSLGSRARASLFFRDPSLDDARLRQTTLVTGMQTMPLRTVLCRSSQGSRLVSLMMVACLAASIGCDRRSPPTARAEPATTDAAMPPTVLPLHASAPVPSSSSIPTAVSFAGAPAALAAPMAKATSRVERAMTKLSEELARRGLPTNCLYFIPEPTTPLYVEFAVRENHTPPACQGDPAVAPIVGRYRVSSSGLISEYDVLEDFWPPLGGKATTAEAVTTAETTAAGSPMRLKLAKLGLPLVVTVPVGSKASRYTYSFQSLFSSDPSGSAVTITIGRGRENTEIWLATGAPDVSGLLGPTVADSDGACSIVKEDDQRLGIYRCKYANSVETFGTISDVAVGEKHYTCHSANLASKALVDRVLAVCKSATPVTK